MKNVAVIMATYNGEKYVREQLDSLAHQTYEAVTVYIHDDNSTDATPQIVRDFIENNNSNIKFVLVGTESLKYPQCFIKTLLEIPKHDYYAFCDQDDVWFPDKIEVAVKTIEQVEYKKGKRKPVLFYSAVDYYDGQLNYMRGARFRQKEAVKLCGLEEMLLGGEAMGMTFLFNNEVRNMLKEITSRGALDFKDTFIKIYCAACGYVVYSSSPCAKYRRHSAATTAGMNPAGNIQRVVNMAKKIFVKKNGLASIQDSVNYVYQNFADRLIPENKELISLFSTPNSIGKRFKKVFWRGRFRLKIQDEIGYRIAFLMGRI